MNKLRGCFSRLRCYVPTPSLLFFVLFLLAVATHLVARLSPDAADFINRYIAFVPRAVLGYGSGWFPFSLAEVLILLIPVWLGLLVFFAVRISRDRLRSARFLCFLLSLLVLFYAVFVFTFGCGYFGRSLDEKLALEKKEVSAEQLYETACWLIEQVKAREGAVAFTPEGSSQMPYSYAGMDQALVSAYQTLSAAYPFVTHICVGSKPVLLSSPMTYTHITGVYTFFTGEANVNTTYPDYSTVYTAAHELAHQRGIARENEANFVAFLACIRAEDSYLNYAGYFNMLQYVMNALYRADRKLYQSLALTDHMIGEMRAYNRVYDKYDGQGVGQVADKLNNAYLQGMGTEGVASYGLVVDLAVAYYETMIKTE